MMSKALIGDVQHFSIDDGDGIRTTVFFKGCNLNCPWCHNPEMISPLPQLLSDKLGARWIGRYMSRAEVIREVLEDKDFYGEKGGVTFSGGEPMLKADFIKDVCIELKSLGINSAVDTAGSVSFDEFAKLTSIVDTFLYDIKANNSKDYKEIGGNYELIFSNLKNLLKQDTEVIVRIPVIPKWNDSAQYNTLTARMLADIGVKRVDLIPYHRLGASKYTSLNQEYAYKDIPSTRPNELKHLIEIYKQNNILTQIKE